MTLTSKQLKMAMAAEDITLEELAQAAGVTPETVSRLRTGASPGRAATHHKIIAALRQRGITFSSDEKRVCVCAPVDD